MITEEIKDLVFFDGEPDVPGLIFRRFRGEADYPHMLAVINGSKEEDDDVRSDTLEDIARNYSHLKNSNPDTDMLFAEVNGEVIAYSRVWWTALLDGSWIGSHLVFLMPDWRQKGIGRFMLRHNERRLRQIAADLITTGTLGVDTPKSFEVYCSDTEKAKEILISSEGYQPIRHFFEMVRPDYSDIPEAPMPPGLEVRPAQPKHYRQIWEADKEAFRDHWGYTELTDEDFEAWQESPLFQPELWKVAWDGDQVAGMVLNFINHNENEEYERKRGYTEGISTRRPWRKRGLARSLIVQSLHMFKAMGMEEAALGVDSENLSGALRLYESVGFKVTRRNSCYRKPL